MPLTADEFERWLSRERPRLVRSVSRLLGEPVAEDLVQSTLMQVWRAHADGRAADLERYARRAVHLNALKWRARRRATVSLDEVDERTAAEGDPFDVKPWELEAAILGLPAAQQVALRLRFYSGMSFKEVGRALDISLNTAASRCRYALDSLRERFSSQSTGEEGES